MAGEAGTMVSSATARDKLEARYWAPRAAARFPEAMALAALALTALWPGSRVSYSHLALVTICLLPIGVRTLIRLEDSITMPAPEPAVAPQAPATAELQTTTGISAHTINQVQQALTAAWYEGDRVALVMCGFAIPAHPDPRLLCETAQRLHAAACSGGSILALDEYRFAVLCPQVPQHTDMRKMAHRIRHALAQPLDTAGTRIMHQPVVIAKVAQPSDDAASLVAAADDAWHQARIRRLAANLTAVSAPATTSS